MTQIKKLDKYIKLIEVFDVFKDYKDVCFLSSSQKNNLGRYSIIGVNPYHNIVVKDNKTIINGQEVDIDFYEYLKKYLEDNKVKNQSKLPIEQGAIGYISYDFGMKNKDVATRHHKSEIYDVVFNFYDNFIIEDNLAEETYILANGKLCVEEISTKQIEDKIRDAIGSTSVDNLTIQEEQTEQQAQNQEYSKTHISITSDFTKEGYQEAISKMVNYMIEGDIYVANMTRRIEVTSPKTPYEMFKTLSRNNPSAFGGYFSYDDYTIVSASPERFLKLKDGHVNTKPIKGTRPRGNTLEEDAANRNELINSEKDKSELLMVVDLERNDLNKVCTNVRVNKLYEIEEHATVFHLVSDINGILKPGLNAADLIKATFPGGSITGTPKKRAMEIIDELEQTNRGIYTGSIGYISLNGDMDLNIIIRTALYKDGKYQIGVGGGITYESESDFEYEETNQKALELLKSLE